MKKKEKNMTEKIKNFQDLRIWQKGIEIVKDVYMITKKYPKEELYSLTSQMRRSAISIPSNIAEGFRRFHNKEYKQFLYIALGSCAELETQVIISKELNYIKDDEKNLIVKKIHYVCRMTIKLIQKLYS